MKKKVNKKKQNPQPAPPATDHPTGTPRPFSMRTLFSLAGDPQPVFLHNQLFHSYSVVELKNELGRIEGLHKQNNGPFDTRWLCEQIRLIELLNTPEDGTTRLKWEYEQADALQSELMYRLAKDGNNEAFESLNRKTYEQFWRLKRMASDGHEGALQALALMAIEATEVVNRHVVESREQFKSVAAEHTHWPFLKSLNKQLNLIKTNDEDSILRQLDSGKNTQQDLAPAKRNKTDKPGAVVAQKLLNYVRGVRKDAQLLFRGLLHDEPPNVAGIPNYLIQAGRLPDVVKDHKGADKWWKLARRFLLESYPALNPESSADLNSIAPALLALSQVADQARRRKRILYNLERDFKTILAIPPGTVRISS